MSAPRISVIVCSKDGGRRIGACLDALAAQTHPSFEVIVVDDGSTDDTGAIALSRGVRVERHPGSRGLAAARNTGTRAAQGAIVAFTDDDCLPHADWLERLDRGYARPDALAVGGTAIPDGPPTPMLRYLRLNNPLEPLELDLAESASIPYRFVRYVVRNLRPRTPTGERPVYAFVGASMSFRRDLLEAAGGFDERFRFGSEEEELCGRLRRLHPDGVLLLVPDAQVDHVFDTSLRDTLRRSRAYGRGNARMHLKEGSNPTLYPFPVLVGALALGAVARPGLAVAAAAAPLALFPRGPLAALRSRDWVHAAAPYVQLLQEASSDVGFARGWLQMRGQFREERAARAAAARAAEA